MKTLTLVLSLLALLGALASAGLYVLIGNTKEALQSDLAASEARAARLSTDLADATERSESLQRQINALDADLGDTKSKLTSAESRTVQLSRDLNQARSQLNAREAAEEALTRELATVKRELVQNRLAAAQSVSPQQAEAYRESIAKMEDQITQLQNRLAAMPARTAATTSGGSGEPTARLTADRSMNARVVTVGPKNAFVILNYGSANGASLAQQLLVRRGPDPMARVEISDVRENYSIAQVQADTLQGSLQKGDAAMLVN